MKRKFYIKSIKALAIISLTGILSSCGGDGQNSGNQQVTNSDSTQKEIEQLDPNQTTLVQINSRLFSVPSPIQIAQVIKSVKLPYNRELLNLPSKRQEYTTSFKQALNLGVYGANLGYINIFEQLPDAAAYFAAIRGLSSELGILNTFNEATMKRIEDNNSNKDSLLYIFSTLYRKSDSYLMLNDRNEIGALILAGGFVEGLYLLTHIAHPEEMPKEVQQKIGEQKNPLNNLIELLRPYYGSLSDEYDNFLEQLSELGSIFDNVTIEYTYKPSVTDENNKITTINSTSTTIISKDQIKEIKTRVNALRNFIVN